MRERRGPITFPPNVSRNPARMMPTPLLLLIALLLPLSPASGQGPAPSFPNEGSAARCQWSPESGRNPNREEIRCRHGIRGPGRFGLTSYADVPVYQPHTPLPGSHVVGVRGLPGPRAGESFEQWEWRVLRTEWGPGARRVHRELEVLEPRFAARLLRLEQRMREEGVRGARRETWRSPERQAFLFQQGRSRPGPFATTTLTSWHSRMDERGNPAAAAADYNVPAAHMPRFHTLAAEVGLQSYGADSNDPGHVFMVQEEDIPAGEVALLRLFPRVPVVTLATGRPDGEWMTPPRLRLLRQIVARFAHAPVPTLMAPRPVGSGAIVRFHTARGEAGSVSQR